MTIQNAQVVYVVGPSGTGKSFTGDYLQVVHGYKHVDGDGPLKSCADPTCYEMTHNMITSNGKKELWSPYFEEIAKRAVDAAKHNDKVVLSHATYQQEVRDVVIEKIVEGGVPRDHITIIELTIDMEVKLRFLYRRNKRGAEQSGITIEEGSKSYLKWEGDELTEEKFVKAMLKSNGGDAFGVFEDCPIATKVDVSGRDISHCDNIDKALGLNRSDDWTYDSICDKVLPLDKERDAEMIANGSAEALGKLMAKVSTNPAIKDDDNDTEEEKELKQKRRSTIIETKSWRNIDFGKLDLEDDE